MTTDLKLRIGGRKGEPGEVGQEQEKEKEGETIQSVSKVRNKKVKRKSPKELFLQ